MDIVLEFLNENSTAIIKTILYIIFAILGVAIKAVCTRYINDKTKLSVAMSCVRAVEQIYHDIHGEEKLNKCIELACNVLAEKGIKTSSVEIKLLIESAVQQMNREVANSLNAATGNNPQPDEDSSNID